VFFDSNLSFESHVNSICKPAFFHLKNTSKLHHMLSLTNAEQLVHVLMTDYCNDLPRALLNKEITAGPKWFCQPCIGFLLNIVLIQKYF